MKSILDPTFSYVSAADTNLKRTFARIKREQEKEKARLLAMRDNVKMIRKVKA